MPCLGWKAHHRDGRAQARRGRPYWRHRSSITPGRFIQVSVSDTGSGHRARERRSHLRAILRPNPLAQAPVRLSAVHGNGRGPWWRSPVSSEVGIGTAIRYLPARRGGGGRGDRAARVARSRFPKREGQWLSTTSRYLPQGRHALKAPRLRGSCRQKMVWRPRGYLASRAARGGRPDAVMPSFRAATRWYAMRALGSLMVPIILSSGCHAMTRLRSGARRFLGKPFRRAGAWVLGERRAWLPPA